MEVEEIEKRISSNGYEVICRNICGTTLAIAPKEKVYIYTIIPSIPANDNQVIQEGIANHNVFRKLLNFIFEDTLDGVDINIESVFICTYDIPENTKQQLDENNIRYLSPYMNDNCFNSIFPKIENLDSCYYNEYKSYIETVVKYIISSVSNGDYNGFLEWLIAKYCGFDSIEELIDNFIDCGNYIELKKPIDGIYMIQKSFSENASFENALKYAKELTLGGFNDWQVPTIGNLKTIQRLKDILHLNITDSKELFWSSSWFYDLRIRYYNGFEQPCKMRYVINFRDGYVFDDDECDIKCNFFCVRIAMEKMCTHDTKYYPDLTSIVIPNTVMKIGESAFFHCIGLTSVVIPNSIKIIDKYAFEGCKSLKSIVIPDSVTEIGDSAFKQCTGLTSVVISSSVKEIGNCAFYGCERLKSIVIPDSVTKIGDSAFENCTGLTSVVISSSVKEIGNCAFYGCESLVDIKIIGNNKKFGDEVFANCTRLSQGSKYVVAQCKYAYNNNDKAIVQLENNFVDRGDYIEFIEPINGIVMVQKDCSISLDWEGAKEYAKTMNLGGFNDWAIPRIHELQTLYDIKEFCGIKETDNCFWSSSYRSCSYEDYEDCDMCHRWNEDQQQTLNFYNGKIIREKFLTDHIEEVESFKTISLHVRCIRTINVDEERLDRYYEGTDQEDCFITTAVCKTFGKPDDCPELTAFRTFRDTYMANKKDLNQEVQKYYEIAPAICAAIDAKGDEFAKQEYARIWDKYLSKAFKALKDNKLNKTYDVYKEMVLSLEEDYLI